MLLAIRTASTTMIDPLKLRDPYDSIEFRSYQKCPQCIMCLRNDKIQTDAVWICDDCRGEWRAHGFLPSTVYRVCSHVTVLLNRKTILCQL